MSQIILQTQYANRLSQEIEPPLGIEKTTIPEIRNTKTIQEKYLKLANDVLKNLNEITTKEATSVEQFETFIKNLQNFIALMFYLSNP